MDVKSLQPSALFLQPCAKALYFGGLALVGLVFGTMFVLAGLIDSSLVGVVMFILALFMLVWTI